VWASLALTATPHPSPIRSARRSTERLGFGRMDSNLCDHHYGCQWVGSRHSRRYAVCSSALAWRWGWSAWLDAPVPRGADADVADLDASQQLRSRSNWRRTRR